MLVHLSSTSPYVCDISLGPIEQANRMASAPTIQSLSYLEIKESFPKFRTPLKLLAPDEIPIDTNITSTIENNLSRQQSLQPIWYTEQTIVDDNNEQQRNTIKSPCHHHELTRSTLPTIESNSPDIEDEIIEKEIFSNQPSLMRKSSTFTIEQQPSIDIPSTLNESEKENDFNSIMTSTQEVPTNHPIRHPTEPSDESFRALEHLLGLGSINPNITMITTTQESPKSNHESLSLTMVTPTELINQTTTSLHLSYAPHGGGGGSLPSSQNILLMPTIESITEPSMNSTIPPPFLVDNSDIEEPSSTTGTVINNQESYENNSNITEDSFHFTDEDDEKQDTPSKEDTNTEEDSNFSFELNDFQNNSKDLINDEIIQPPIITIRAPTSADVAFRALIKSRTSGRLSQPNKTVSPLAKTNANNLPTCSSVPIQTSRVLRSSISRISTTPTSENSTTEEINRSNSETTIECVSTESKTPDDYPNGELIEVVSLPEEDEIEYEPAAGITLNLTASKDTNILSPNSAEEADRSASSSSPSYISYQEDISTPNNPKLPVLSREYSYNTPTTRSAEHRRSVITNRRSHNTRLIHSMIPRISEQQQTTITEEEKDLSSENTSLCSYPSSLKPILSILSTNQTVISEGPQIILQKSLAGSASPSPMITIRKSERLSSSLTNLSPRRSIHPLHSSTPSIRNKSLQIVSIDEQEQISTIVPKQFHLNLSKNDIEMFDKQQQVDIPIEIRSMSHESIQTSPERRPRLIDVGIQTTPIVSHRYFQTIEQQTTPIVKHSSSSSSCQTTPVVFSIQRSNTQQTSPIIETSTKLIFEEEKQHEVTPIHSKAIMHLRRNVRFQFTPSTDARLAAKEKLEEEDQQQRLKQEIPIINHNDNTTTKQILSDNEREEDTEDEIKKIRKTKKKTTISKKKKHITLRKNDDSSEETIESPIRNQPEKLIPNDEEQTTTTQSKKKISKRSKRHEKKSSPIREPELIVITSSPVQTKRITRKRSNPKTTTIPTSETTSPTEPVSKRAKTTKTIENKQPARVPSPEPPSTRSRSKTPVISSNNIKSISSSESIERILPRKKTKKNSSELNPIENPPISMNNKRKNSTSTIKKSKRRLHSVEQDEGLNTADEEETIQTISHPIEIISIDLNQEEREKIEGLTVAELKARLITHGENIPKGIRKADLVALLIKIETNLLKERKQTETAVPITVPANSTSRKTRRKK